MAGAFSLDTLRRYARALREEPKLRFFFLWTLIDDLGNAVVSWAAITFVNDYLATPEAVAAYMLRALLGQLAGSILAGPLADWPGKDDPERLARWRYKIVVWRYLIAFVIFGVLV